ncbi:MAG: hypothetical protein ACI93H_000216 [Psychromonas sp.]
MEGEIAMKATIIMHDGEVKTFEGITDIKDKDEVVKLYSLRNLVGKFPDEDIRCLDTSND